MVTKPKTRPAHVRRMIPRAAALLVLAGLAETYDRLGEDVPGGFTEVLPCGPLRLQLSVTPPRRPGRSAGG